MSEISDMIRRLCPDGVEYRKLGEVTIWDKKFSGVDRKMQPEVIQYPYVLAKVFDEIETSSGDVRLLQTGISSIERWTTEEKAGDYLCEGEIVAIPGGGTPNVKYYKGKFVTADNRIVTSSNTKVLDNKYLYYYLENNIDTLTSFYRGAGIQHPSMFHVLNFEIPVPPLEVQRKIVEVLDNFSELTAELTAELEARRKQYEYYRDNLLNFNRGGQNASDVKWMKLGEVFEMRNGYTPSKAKLEFWENGTIPWFRMEDIRQNGRILSDSVIHVTPEGIKGKGVFKANSFIIATTATIGEHALLIADSLANQRFANLKICKSLEKELLTKFVFYYLFVVDEWCKANVNVSGFASVDMTKFKNFLFPIPPISEQERIVSILDRFEAMTTDLTSGLPAEIKARRQQYEYYRDSLLSFPRKSSNS